MWFRFLFFVCLFAKSLVLQIANQLDRFVGNLERKPLKVMVQVNTSGEECKFSCSWILESANSLGDVSR